MNSRGVSNVSAIISIALILGGLGGYLYFLQDQLNDVTSNIDNLRREIASVNRELERELSSAGGDLNEQIQIPNQIPSRSEGEISAIADLYERARESVVSIQTVNSQGSGWVFDTENHIVTNNHVVAGVSEAVVTLYNRITLSAVVIGNDPFSDLAVLEVIDSSISLKPLPLGNSNDIRVGEPVIAIGNPFGFSGSVSSGIVSQKGRLFPSQGGYSISNMIQIDVPINPGNSGGPLINMRGEVVGITTGAITNTGAFSGVGFAIPASTSARVVPDLIQNGFYEHPWIGVAGLNIDRSIADVMNLDLTRGFLITQIFPGSPALEGGLRAGGERSIIGGNSINIGGDVIIAVDGRDVFRLDDIISYIDENKRPADDVVFTVIRDGRERDITVILGVRPPP
ncbi:MAG: trypsin-like peptidase domain-containing protein [Thaumarchaeota archaeon]|nr:trypsin-like peptidase domain-containing protein [Nitrososphaerota archaeon]